MDDATATPRDARVTTAEGEHRTADGITLATRTWVPAEPRALVVLVHGFAEHLGRYDHVVDALVGAGFAVGGYDQRGHGRSSGPRAVVRDVAGLADDLVGVRTHLAAQVADLRDGGTHAGEALPQALLGHSMGGAVVLEHLLGEHAPVAAVALSGPYVRNAAAVNPVLRAAAPILGRLLPAAPTQALDAGDVSRDPAVVAAYEADPLVFHGAVPAATGAALLAVEGRVLPRAGTITEPVLVLHGSEDRLAAVSGSRDLARAIGSDDVTLRTYPGLHHEIFNEPEQDEVLADLVGWLDQRL